MRVRKLTGAVVVIVALAMLAACNPYRWPPAPNSPGPHYYVAMGDSLSTGTQPPFTPEHNFGDTDEGYTDQLYKQVAGGRTRSCRWSSSAAAARPPSR